MRVTSHPPSASDSPSPFFVRLERWELAPRAAEAFQRTVNVPIAAPQPVFYTRLYHHLVDFLLERLDLPRTAGSAEWEWKALYQFGQAVDPFYFTEASIQELLERWPVITFAQRQLMASVLSGFLHLRRAGFPACYPSSLLPVHEMERWTRLFPADWAWDCLEVLRRMGFSTMAGRNGYRAYVRFSEGRFDAELDANSLRRWFAECWRAGPVGAHAEPGSEPHQANFIAGALAGRARALGVEGPCGPVPDCLRCDLRDECAWFNSPLRGQSGPSEVLAWVRRGHVEALRTDQLLQGLYGLKDADAERLRTELGGDSLRSLASQTRQELQARFGFDGLLSEKLSLTFELCRRFNEERMPVGGAFQTPWDVFKHFRMRLRDLKQEQFIVVLLDNKKRFLNDLVVTQGTLNTSPVHPREVFSAAIREHAASVVIVHNHPSGDPQPSREDIHVTQQLIKVGELVGIPVLDHIIIVDDLYISMLEQGLLKG